MSKKRNKSLAPNNCKYWDGNFQDFFYGIFHTDETQASKLIVGGSVKPIEISTTVEGENREPIYIVCSKDGSTIHYNGKGEKIDIFHVKCRSNRDTNASKFQPINF